MSIATVQMRIDGELVIDAESTDQPLDNFKDLFVGISEVLLRGVDQDTELTIQNERIPLR
jgi:hypothetical protein